VVISEFDKKAKPTSIAIDELLTDKLGFKYVEEEAS
jgi:DNA-directed RNA polymerase subunit K/omega